MRRASGMPQKPSADRKFPVQLDEKNTMHKLTDKQLSARDTTREVMHNGASAEECMDAAIEAEWAAEIRRRIAALDAGAPTTPWDEARKRIASA